MLAETTTGPNILNDGAQKPLRSDRQGALVATDAHGRYQEAVVRGNVFTAANQAVQALSLNSTATATGLILTNPAGSGKNLALLEIECFIAAAVTAVANVVLMANINPVAVAVAHTTPVTVRNAFLGSGTSAVGLVDSAATLPAVPILVRSLFGWTWVTAGTTASQLGVKDEVSGALILAPGTAVSLAAVTVAHSVIAAFTWEEIPV